MSSIPPHALPECAHCGATVVPTDLGPCHELSGLYACNPDAPPAQQTTAEPVRRLCAHADDDGRGMHWLEPGAGIAPGGAEKPGLRRVRVAH